MVSKYLFTPCSENVAADMLWSVHNCHLIPYCFHWSRLTKKIFMFLVSLPTLLNPPPPYPKVFVGFSHENVSSTLRHVYLKNMDRNKDIITSHIHNILKCVSQYIIHHIEEPRYDMLCVEIVLCRILQWILTKNK